LGEKLEGTFPPQRERQPSISNGGEKGRKGPTVVYGRGIERNPSNQKKIDFPSPCDNSTEKRRGKNLKHGPSRMWKEGKKILSRRSDLGFSIVKDTSKETGKTPLNKGKKKN